MALRISKNYVFQSKDEIVLPSGVKCTVKALRGVHQKLLTEQKVNVKTRFNRLLVDVIDDIDGTEWPNMREPQRMRFVRDMLSADRKFILTEARQLSKQYNPTYTHLFDWKNDRGVKQETELSIELISEDNQKPIVCNIAKMCGIDGDVYDETFLEELTEQQNNVVSHIKQLNRTGCFPTKPYLKTYDSYKDVLANLDCEFDGILGLDDYKFKIKLLTGAMEENTDTSNVSSHTRILSRLPRYQDTTDEKQKWRKLTSEDLDDMPPEVIDDLRNRIIQLDGDVDTVETFPHPDESNNENVHLDLLGQISFFFPSGRV